MQGKEAKLKVFSGDSFNHSSQWYYLQGFDSFNDVVVRLLGLQSYWSDCHRSSPFKGKMSPGRPRQRNIMISKQYTSEEKEALQLTVAVAAVAAVDKRHAAASAASAAAATTTTSPINRTELKCELGQSI